MISTAIASDIGRGVLLAQYTDLRTAHYVFIDLLAAMNNKYWPI